MAAVGVALAVTSCLTQAAQASQAPRPGTAMTAAATAAPVTMPRAASLLYSQDNHASGYALVSQNVGTGNKEDSQAADDFTVPKGQSWTITQLNVAGAENGTPASETVFLYKNTVNTKKRDVPGTLVKKQRVKGKNTHGSLVITGITGVMLPAGHYWVSVQATLASGEWGWASRTVRSGSPAVWENPGNGFGTGCTAWTPYQSCTGASGRPDLMFALYGSSKG